MAWRLSDLVVEGEIDNTTKRKSLRADWVSLR